MKFGEELYNTTRSPERMNSIKDDLIKDSDGSITVISDVELSNYIEDIDKAQTEELLTSLNKFLAISSIVFFNDVQPVIINTYQELLSFFSNHPFYTYVHDKKDILTLYDADMHLLVEYQIFVAYNKDPVESYTPKMSAEQVLLAYCQPVYLSKY